MYEIQSCGVTLDITPSHVEAVNTFNRAIGPVVKMFKYAGSTKSVVQSKYNTTRSIHSQTKES